MIVTIEFFEDDAVLLLWAVRCQAEMERSRYFGEMANQIEAAIQCAAIDMEESRELEILENMPVPDGDGHFTDLRLFLHPGCAPGTS